MRGIQWRLVRSLCPPEIGWAPAANRPTRRDKGLTGAEPNLSESDAKSCRSKERDAVDGSYLAAFQYGPKQRRAQLGDGLVPSTASDSVDEFIQMRFKGLPQFVVQQGYCLLSVTLQMSHLQLLE